MSYIPNQNIESPAFFIDRRIGGIYLANGMKAAGYSCVVHDDFFEQDAPDEEWIEFASQRNWVILTRDNSARHRRTFLSYVQIYSSRVFIARMRNAHSDYILHSLVQGKNKIEHFLESNDPPFIAGIQSNGDINKYELPNISN